MVPGVGHARAVNTRPTAATAAAVAAPPSVTVGGAQPPRTGIRGGHLGAVRTASGYSLPDSSQRVLAATSALMSSALASMFSVVSQAAW